MGLIESLFKNQISKAVNSQVAGLMGGQFANQLDSLVSFMNKGLPTINPDGYDYNKVFKTIGAVYEVTDLISKKVIGSPYVFYKVKDKGKLQESKRLQLTDPVQSYLLKLQAIEEVNNPSLLNVLNNPNKFQTGMQFVWTTALTYLLHGNSYLHGTFDGSGTTKRALELYCFPNMTIQADNTDLLNPIRGFILENTDQRKFEKDEIYHLKTGNPAPIDMTLDYLYGVSSLRAYLEPLRTIKEAQEQSSKQAKNGGVFGLLSPRDKENRLDPEQKQQLKDKMAEARRSNDEMARVFPSTISLLWQSIGLPIADLQLIELVNANNLDIYRAYHVPPQFYDASSGTFSNQATAVKQFIYDCVAPVCNVIGEALTRFVGKGYGDIIIELDYTQLQEMAVNMKEVSDYIIPLVEKGIITPDEARAALKYGETGFDFMKEYYVNSGIATRRSVFSGVTSTPPVN